MNVHYLTTTYLSEKLVPMKMVDIEHISNIYRHISEVSNVNESIRKQ